MALTKQELHQIELNLNRKPTVVEEHIFDTMWSEHCSYKSSKPVLKTLPTKGSEVALGIGEDAGIIRFTEHDGDSYGIAVSHESHNHPSQILPVEGSATGVGGCVRDVYCMGADVIGVLNSLHFGINSDGKTPIVDEIAEKVVFGISDYGNPLGVPVLGGETLYHESYNDNCLVNVAAVGLIKESGIIHSYVPKAAQTVPYDVILVGKSTDATGFGGASFSSATLDKENEQTNIGAVQVHDPFLKRVLVEAIKAFVERVRKDGIEVGFKDLGAGGISCATSEIAVGGGFGVDVNLNDVNVAFPGLSPEVIACSETQERFCIVVPQTFTQTVLDIFNKDFAMPELYPNAGAVKIGHIIQDPRFIMSYDGEVVCDLPVEQITTEVSAHRETEEREMSTEVPSSVSFVDSSLEEICNLYLKDLNTTNKRHVYTHFDNAVRGDTVLYPGEGDAVVVTPIDGCDVGLAVSMDSNLYGNHDPYISGAYAVAESVRNIISVGAKPIALTDCLNYGNPEKPSVFFDFKQGVKGICDAANALSFIKDEPIPIISGNVSFYNDSKQGNAVVPSPVILCTGKIEDAAQATGCQVFQPGLDLLLVGERHAEFGGTQIESHLSGQHPTPPQVRLSEEAKQNHFIYDLHLKGILRSVHDISIGGLWMSLVEMVMGEHAVFRVGAELNATDSNAIPLLFSENGGYLIAVHPNVTDGILEDALETGIYCQKIGRTTESQSITIEGLSKPLSFDSETIKADFFYLERS